MQREPLKSRLKMDTEFDRLGDLPSEVTEKILSVLPIKEAVRTSILSSQWRYKWATRTDLVFDEVSFPEEVYNHVKLVKIIDHVLFLHIGPIHKVKLSHKHLADTSDIDRWILHLSRNSMKEFRFCFWKLPPYKMPSCLFSCQDLVHLELFNCSLKPSRTFKGFKNLKKLVLIRVTLTQDDFENLIVSCSVLEELKMKEWSGFSRVKIDAPNIQFLQIFGAFDDLSLQNTLNLVCLHVSLEPNGDQRSQVLGNSSNLVKLFSQCARIHCVALSDDALKYLSSGDFPLKLPGPFLHLTSLLMDIPYNDLKEILTALYIIRRAPALQRLYMALPKVRQKELAIVGETNSWLDGNRNFELRKLRIVDTKYISSTRAELEFIELLLLNSPVLEKLFVKPASHDCCLELSERLNGFRRSSAQAEIVLHSCVTHDHSLHFGS